MSETVDVVRDSVRDPFLARKCAAELIGAFALVFIGVLAVGTSGQDIVAVGLAHGLAIAVMVATFAAVSGAHFNPAITLGFLVTRRTDVVTAIAYIASQLVGAVLAALVVKSVVDSGKDWVIAGTPRLGDTGMGGGITLEAIATFFLVLVVFGTAVDLRAPAAVFPLAIGLTIALDVFAIGGLTGAAMNPARAFGPALVSGEWNDHLVYWIGPLVGGAIAALLYVRFFGVSEGPSKTAGDTVSAQPTQSL